MRSWLPALADVGQLDLLVWLAPDCAGMRRVSVPAVDATLAGTWLNPRQIDRHRRSHLFALGLLGSRPGDVAWRAAETSLNTARVTMRPCCMHVVVI